MDKYQIGDVVHCVVTGIQTYGFFVKFADNLTRLVHISEVSPAYVKNINDYVNENEEIWAQIIEIDKNKQQYNLSIKNLDYRHDGKVREQVDVVKGFKPLKDNLPLWEEEMLKQMQDK